MNEWKELLELIDLLVEPVDITDEMLLFCSLHSSSVSEVIV